jgi:hypothetical protein
MFTPCVLKRQKMTQREQKQRATLQEALKLLLALMLEIGDEWG